MFVPTAVALAAAFWTIVLVALAVEKHVFDQALRLWKSLSKFNKCVVAAILFGVVAFAGTKPLSGGGDDPSGTNVVEIVEDGAEVKVRGEGEQWNLSTCFADQQKKESNILCSPSPFTFTSTLLSPLTFTSTLPAPLSLGAVGRGESFDFSAPEGAMVATNWLMHGATTGRIRVSPSDWEFPFGTNVVRSFAAFADGRLEPWPGGDGVTLAPLVAPLGIVPEANWSLLAPTNRPSLFWWAQRGNALVCTWQNVLLGRETDCPVSFQAELRATGGVTYRYDLGRLASDDPLTNVAVLAGNGEAISRSLLMELAQSYTSGQESASPLSASPLSASPFSDSPLSRDLTSLAFRSAEEADCDEFAASFAAAMAGADPFACPAGSTNTIFEHMFYTGTTNAPFAYPSDTADTAVLVVTVSGVGSGELMVGDRVVPLLARPRPRLLMGANGAPDPTAMTLRVPVPRGTVQTCFLRVPESLEVALSSAEFVYGRRPTFLHPFGWLAFPNTKAKEPCIHDLGTGGVDVSLDPGAEISGLTCTWNGATGIEVENRPPLAARLTGRFPRNSTTPITYVLDHPDYLFGETTYTQTARFCPSHSDDDNEGGRIPPRPVDSEYGDEDEERAGCSCSQGTPCGDPWCGCGCSCCSGDDDDMDAPLDVCPVHDCPYGQCEHLHRGAYTNAIAQAVNQTVGVLKLDRDPHWRDPVPIRVPDTFVRCCPCPDHWTNYVALAAKSYNLAVRTADGERFTKTVEDCTVFVSGLAPSFDFDDSFVSLCKTGVVYETRRYTVLGLKIDCPYFDLAKLNRANPDFGLPVVVCTNRLFGTMLRLRTDVDLPDGDVHIGFSDPTPGFRLYLGHPTDGAAIGGSGGELLVDSSEGGSFDVSLKQWKRILRERGNGREAFVTLVAEHEGTADLEFGYAVERDGVCKGDFVTQRLTAIRSPLMADYNHNGAIDATDRELHRAGRPFRFWINEDTVRGDQSLGNKNEVPNADDHFVNGKWDLVNLFPVAVDLSALTNAWRGSRVSYRIGGHSYGSSLNVTFADVPWGNLASIQTNVVETVYGDPLCEAPLSALCDGDVELSETALSGFGENSGAIIAESTRWDSDAVALKAFMDGVEVFRCALSIFTSPVQYMYRWINARDPNQGVRPTDLNVPYNAPYVQPGAKNLVMLHGANVSPVNAEKWGDYIFKRFWHAGFQGNYYFVSWWSDKGATGANYQENVSNAFVTAGSIAETIKAIPGDKVLMAHSLGNMVVSSMIEDHGLVPSAYIMCNSAVPTEAFDPAIESTNVLVHSEWVGYPTNTWSKSWYSLFPASDARSKLTWRGRFPNVVQYAYNFYSTGDHCLELFRNNNPGIFDYEGDSSQKFEQYCWHKQDIWKGRASVTEGLGGTSWSGWGFARNALGLRKYSVEDAQTMSLTPDVLKTNTVFRINPQSMNTNVIERIVLDAHLAQGIPAWAPATGAVGYSERFRGRSTDLNNEVSPEVGLERPNDWPTFSIWRRRWLHSDMKDRAYFYVFKFYEKVMEVGGLK